MNSSKKLLWEHGLPVRSEAIPSGQPQRPQLRRYCAGQEQRGAGPQGQALAHNRLHHLRASLGPGSTTEKALIIRCSIGSGIEN